MMQTPRWLTLALVALGASACGFIPAYTRANEAIKPGCPETRASMKPIDDDIFVGIAMSGGGSRAANFSAAVLLELKELGFLQTASALSSVSGSSITAGHYGLFGHDTQKWKKEPLQSILLTDFQTNWFLRWFAPHHVIRYWLTDFDRSDIMKRVFDDYLFEEKTFGALGPPVPGGGPSYPRILINATTRTYGDRFVFTDGQFLKLGSCLADYPMSHAVMASGAFPGFFQNVTLENYRHPQASGERHRYFEHLYDGGVADNLGVETLWGAVQASFKESGGKKPKKCFFFIVDAHTTSERPELEKERDTRKAIDYLVDTNALASVDTLLSKRRLDVLWDIGFTAPEIGREPYQEFKLLADDEQEDGPAIPCAAWHITFQGLLVRSDLPSDAKDVGAAVDSILTRYRLEAPGDPSPEELQRQLFEAARILVRQDENTLQKVCQWFRINGFNDLPCLPGESPHR